jgi:hypothetical protein
MSDPYSALVRANSLHIVPANAGTHNPGRHCAEGLYHYALMRRHGVWVPAFAGTTLV